MAAALFSHTEKYLIIFYTHVINKTLFYDHTLFHELQIILASNDTSGNTFILDFSNPVC